MNIHTLRTHLSKESSRRNSIYDCYHQRIVREKFSDADEIWSNPDLVACSKTPENSAKIIFPFNVNILTTSIFYNRVYLELDNWDHKYNRIETEELFRDHYKMTPADLVKLVELGSVVVLFPLGIEKYSNYILEHIVFPIITQRLPHMTFEGHALVCQAWQNRANALPDPKEKSWGFLMDLCGARGLEANLVRPEWETDIWDKRELIFNELNIDDITPMFHSSNIPLDDFFIASGIEYDSHSPVSEYLSAFKNIDKQKLFSLYKKSTHAAFYEEIQHINDLSKRISNKINQKHIFKKVLSAEMTLAYHFLTEVLWQTIVLIGPLAKAIKKTTDEEFGAFIRSNKSRIVDNLMMRWTNRPEWLSEKWFPEVLELTKVKKNLGR